MENIGLNRSREGKTFWFQVSSFFDERSGRAERRFHVRTCLRCLKCFVHDK